MIGVTLDTGALLALEKQKREFVLRLRRMNDAQRVITIPAVVIAECWRGGRRSFDRTFDAFHVEATTVEIARIAGEAIAAVPEATAIDAIVMASAALRGDTVYTSDYDDLTRLGVYFRGVRVLRV